MCEVGSRREAAPAEKSQGSSFQPSNMLVGKVVRKKPATKDKVISFQACKTVKKSNLASMEPNPQLVKYEVGSKSRFRC